MIFSIFGRIRRRLCQIWRRRTTGLSAPGLNLGARVSVSRKGRVELGENVIIGHDSSFTFNPIDGNCPRIVLGKGVNLGKFNDFGCSEAIIIEDYVITAPYVHITDRDHCYEDIHTPIMHQPTRVRGAVRIGAGSWLGFGVQVMSGVTIGRNCVVAAGAIVTKDIPDYCVAGGNPARILRQYNPQTKAWERVTSEAYVCRNR